MSKKDDLDNAGTPGPGGPGAARGGDDLSRGGTAGGTGPPGAGEYAPGSRIAGRYRVEACLGRGGMGEVYRVVDEARGGVVALKLMREALLDSEDARGRFLREAQISREMDHPGIVRTIDIGTDGSRDFFTMEYLSGGSLRQRMEERRPAGRGFSVGEVLEIADQVLAALEYAHGRTVHRDVTPENVMLTAEGRVKLCDFGIAQVMDWERLTKLTMVRGKPYYMAPEQLSGGRVDGRADVYGLGAVLYELLTGKVPAGRFKLPGELRPGVPESFDRVIGRALDESAGARFPTARAMRDALREVGEGIEVDRRRVRALFAQAKEAKAVRKWDEAVEALERARSIAEDPAGVEAEIGEVKRLAADWADRTERVGALRARAGKARGERRWRAAIEALEEALGLVDDPTVEKELAAARHEQEEGERREREVERLRSIAREHVRDRQWSAALAVLGKVLPLAEDQTAIDREIGEITQAQRAEGEARRARARARAGKVKAVAVFLVVAVLVGGIGWVARTERLAREERAAAAEAQERQEKAERVRELWHQAKQAMSEKDYEKALSALREELPLVDNRTDLVEAEIVKVQEAADSARKKQVKTASSTPTTRTSSVTPLERDGMVFVPAGEFQMGSNDREDDEKPVHTVTLDAFWIDKREVTVGAYKACVNAGRCSEPSPGGSCNWGESGRGNHPVNCVNWNQGKSYCEFAGKRLPTDAEWEKAARGTDGRTYPWGNEESSCQYAVMDDGGEGCGKDSTWQVGSMLAGASPYGALDMAGNVWEWVAEGVLRGGSWADYPRYLRASFRFRFGPRRDNACGFRCARGGQ